jgi:hypothetical protein
LAKVLHPALESWMLVVEREEPSRMPAPRDLTELEADISRDLELVAHPRAA